MKKNICAFHLHFQALATKKALFSMSQQVLNYRKSFFEKTFLKLDLQQIVVHSNNKNRKHFWKMHILSKFLGTRKDRGSSKCRYRRFSTTRFLEMHFWNSPFNKLSVVTRFQKIKIRKTFEKCAFGLNFRALVTKDTLFQILQETLFYCKTFFKNAFLNLVLQKIIAHQAHSDDKNS